MKNTGKPYEALTEQVFIRLLVQGNICSKVERDVVLEGKSTKHQIDVTFEFVAGPATYRTIIQCKDWGTAVKQEQVLAFHGVLTDIPGQPRGIMVSRSGLEPDDIRGQFDDAFKKFGQSLDMLLPDPKALPYVGDAKWLGKVRQVAAAKFCDDKIDISDCGAKVRKLIEEAVSADGIQILVKQVSLFAPEFEEKIKALKTAEAQASEMEHAIRHEIHIKLEENPVFYTSLRERLEQLIEDRKAKRIDAAQQLQLFETLRNELRGHASAAERVGLSETGFAIYGLLVDPKPLKIAERAGTHYGTVDNAKKELASILEEQLEPHVALVDWARKDDVQREMRKRIKRQLRAANFKDEQIEMTAENIVDLLKRRRAR